MNTPASNPPRRKPLDHFWNTRLALLLVAWLLVAVPALGCVASYLFFSPHVGISPIDALIALIMAASLSLVLVGMHLLRALVYLISVLDDPQK